VTANNSESGRTVSFSLPLWGRGVAASAVPEKTPTPDPSPQGGGEQESARLTPREPTRLSRFNVASLALGLAFLYLPIVILVIYSFNASRLVTVWGGWSLRWYHEFFNDSAMIEAAWMSLRVGTTSATIATLLGTLAAVALSRGERFRGRTLFSGMLYAPLVMPEVISGLSLLLLFVALNAERGFWTVTIAHTTLTMCFVAVVVQSRLGSLDRGLEEAAMDLGCNPAHAFVAVTLPLIVPAIAAGWMLAFTLSLDDLVIASFTTGPGSATLPIRIYSEVRLGVKPEINAICTLVIAAITLLIVMASLASKLSNAREESAAPL
jgi:putrescine transport system permease protein